MGYTHFDKVSGINGLGVGMSGSEKVVADADGHLYQGETEITATGAEINRACDASTRVITVATTPLAITELAHDGKVIVLTKTDGQAVTLPAATGSGTKLHFILGATVASVGTTINTSALDEVLIGNALQLADGGETVGAYEAAATTNGIAFNGSTTGGLKGDSVELIDIAAKTWFVRIVSAATDSEATPFVTRS
jgi:hypothetical protein